MTRWIALLALAIGVGFIGAPNAANAGHIIKEHDCVGNDTEFRKVGEAPDYVPDAGCTPPGTLIAPPDNGPFSGSFYDAADDADDWPDPYPFQHDGDEYVDLPGEDFLHWGLLDRGDGMFGNVPTIKEYNLKQVGFPAIAKWRIALKGASVISNIEVVCSVCAMRPQGGGEGETYIPDPWVQPEGPTEWSDQSYFYYKLNRKQKPWELSAKHIPGPAHHDYYYDKKPIYAVGIPGLERIGPYRKGKDVEFLGCKPKILVLENDGSFMPGDIVEVKLEIPGTARLFTMLDVSSCELSYLRPCDIRDSNKASKAAVCGGEF